MKDYYVGYYTRSSSMTLVIPRLVRFTFLPLRDLGSTKKCIQFSKLILNAHYGTSALFLAILMPHDELSASG